MGGTLDSVCAVNVWVGDGVVGCDECLEVSGVGTGMVLDRELVLEYMLGVGVMEC